MKAVHMNGGGGGLRLEIGLSKKLQIFIIARQI